MKTLRYVRLIAACLTLVPALAHARGNRFPDVPGDLVVSGDQRVYLVGHAVGTQQYVCVPSTKSTTGFAWALYGPQATLFNDQGSPIVTHFLSPNPGEGGTPRATWQHARDTSSVWAIASVISDDSNWVAAGAIPWLKLELRGREFGVDGGRRLIDTSFIQRINTEGGIPPETGCAAAENVGAKSLVPYSADYYFYKSRGRQK